MFFEIIYALVPEPNMFQPYFQTGKRPNFMKYTNPEVDKLWDAQAREVDLAKRKTIVQDIERKILGDHVVFPGTFLMGVRVKYPWVKNLRYTGSLYGSESKFEDIWMDK